ncbi:MAG: hypothetical protein RLZZ219_1261 [Cyanobacteriota bacterium]
MDSGNWEIGVSADSLDELFSGDMAGMTLWYLAGYLRGVSDSHAIQGEGRGLVLEPDGEQGWRLRRAMADRAL